ncbi:unnamed protein product [Nyctereutes procyonoides]|uniref:(raccoon dog) hypothetical protein n=1 Tax=Nyctereutes procyonoides TaxID=34880 RepID=A0A811XVU7_NYCPR|nr:unnamed protein product [Nyctereutes procyonoides]
MLHLPGAACETGRWCALGGLERPRDPTTAGAARRTSPSLLHDERRRGPQRRDGGPRAREHEPAAEERGPVGAGEPCGQRDVVVARRSHMTASPQRPRPPPCRSARQPGPSPPSLRARGPSHGREPPPTATTTRPTAGSGAQQHVEGANWVGRSAQRRAAPQCHTGHWRGTQPRGTAPRARATRPRGEPPRQGEGQDRQHGRVRGRWAARNTETQRHRTATHTLRHRKRTTRATTRPRAAGGISPGGNRGTQRGPPQRELTPLLFSGTEGPADRGLRGNPQPRRHQGRRLMAKRRSDRRIPARNPGAQSRTSFERREARLPGTAHPRRAPLAGQWRPRDQTPTRSEGSDERRVDTGADPSPPRRVGASTEKPTGAQGVPTCPAPRQTGDAGGAHAHADAPDGRRAGGEPPPGGGAERVRGAATPPARPTGWRGPRRRSLGEGTDSSLPAGPTAPTRGGRATPKGEAGERGHGPPPPPPPRRRSSPRPAAAATAGEGREPPTLPARDGTGPGGGAPRRRPRHRPAPASLTPSPERTPGRPTPGPPRNRDPGPISPRRAGVGPQREAGRERAGPGGAAEGAATEKGRAGPGPRGPRGRGWAGVGRRRRAEREGGDGPDARLTGEPSRAGGGRRAPGGGRPRVSRGSPPRRRRADPTPAGGGGRRRHRGGAPPPRRTRPETRRGHPGRGDAATGERPAPEGERRGRRAPRPHDHRPASAGKAGRGGEGGRGGAGGRAAAEGAASGRRSGSPGPARASGQGGGGAPPGRDTVGGGRDGDVRGREAGAGPRLPPRHAVVADEPPFPSPPGGRPTDRRQARPPPPPRHRRAQPLPSPCLLPSRPRPPPTDGRAHALPLVPRGQRAGTAPAHPHRTGEGFAGERTDGAPTGRAASAAAAAFSLMILPQVHLRKPCYDFYFL